MYKKMNSTQALSRKFSRINIPNSVSHKDTPNRRSNSTKNRVGVQLLEQSLIAKNKKLTIMIRNMHHFSTNIEEIQWILDEVQKLIESYMKKTLSKYGCSHQMQIQNLYSELIKLIERFSGIEKKKITDMTIPLKSHTALSENINWWNLKQSETIGSFKYTDVDHLQNEEEGPSDFSRINLPTVVKQNISMENCNTDRSNLAEQIRQYKATIQVLNEQITKLQNEKQQLKSNSMGRIDRLQKQLDNSLLIWQSYKGSAKASIERCRQLLMDINSEEREEVHRLLNQMFSLENTVGKDFMVDPQIYQQQKAKKIRELSELNWKIKEVRFELQKSRLGTTLQKTQVLQNIPKDSRQCWMKMLFLQAATIEEVLRATQ